MKGAEKKITVILEKIKTSIVQVKVQDYLWANILAKF